MAVDVKKAAVLVLLDLSAALDTIGNAVLFLFSIGKYVWVDGLCTTVVLFLSAQMLSECIDT